MEEKLIFLSSDFVLTIHVDPSWIETILQGGWRWLISYYKLIGVVLKTNLRKFAHCFDAIQIPISSYKMIDEFFQNSIETLWH